MIAVPLLTFAGTALGNRVRFELKPSFEQRAIRYTAVVAPPGSTKTQPRTWPGIPWTCCNERPASSSRWSKTTTSVT
ncbi:MAG: DUF3987 domain-containing protein [Chloroflexi bacterium]|nr:DUF3987 domain-containing protein [Chloroflexota bacterium]